jgi:hypothetical protein
MNRGEGTLITIMATVAATGNVTISNPGTAVFDGITLSTSDGTWLRRVLLWQQTAGAENGVYIWNGSSSAMTRATDMDTREDFPPGISVRVVRGNTYQRKEFVLSNIDFPTLGSTALVFKRNNANEPPGPVQALSASGQIDCGANDVISRTVLIQSASAGNPVTLTSEPQIAAGGDGQICILRGVDDTESVTITNGDGFDLGVNDTLEFTATTIDQFQYVLADNVWRLMSGVSGGGGGGGGPSTDDLQDVFARGGTISSSTVDNPFCIKDPESAAKECRYWAGGVYVREILGADGTQANRDESIDAGKFRRTLCAGSECERLTGDGVHSYSNVGKPTKAIYFPAGALSTDGTNCGEITEQTLNSGPKVWAFSCADSNSSMFFGSVSMLRTGWDAGPVQFTLHLFHSTTESITFAGDFSAQCRGDSDPINNTWGTGVAADVAITTANDTERQTTGDVTPDGTCAVGDLLIWRYVVDATNFSANAANAKVIGVTLTYKLKTRNGLDE